MFSIHWIDTYYC